MLRLEGLNNTQKSSINKNLIKAYQEKEQLESDQTIKLFNFDRSLEHLDKALYFGIDSQEKIWIDDLVQRGAIIMARLRVIFRGETSQTKAQYFEKVYVRMNKQSVDLLCRLSWYISQAYKKHAL